MKTSMKHALGQLLLLGATLLPLAPQAETGAMPQEVQINGVEFVLIPAGWFYKSGGQTVDNAPATLLDNEGGGAVKVWLDPYYIAKYEARARDLVRFLNTPEGNAMPYAGSQISCSVRGDAQNHYTEITPGDDLPATHLSWRLADRWANWMGFRLPSEMEWEKAARGSDKRRYPWGDDHPDDTYAGFKIDSDCHTWPVSSFRKGRSPYGLHNMAGNVREFVADWYDRAGDRALKDGDRNPANSGTGTVVPYAEYPADYQGPWKILKGGRWASHERQLEIGARIYYSPDDPFRCNGTRFAIDVGAVRRHLAQGSATVLTP